jgi:lipoprotein-releasing system ATP-binding protein
MNEPILHASNVYKAFQQGKNKVAVLNNITLLIPAQQTIAIVGASGSGKSTLLHLLGGLDAPTEGKILIAGQDVTQLSDQARSALRNQHLGFVYQFHHLLAEFSAIENVAMPLLIQGETKVRAHVRAADMIKQVGLIQRLHHRPGELSGGERQRIAIARAMVTQPACLLADEPTGNLDQHNARLVLDLMLELNAIYHTALIIVTHDMTLAAKMNQTYSLVDGYFV